MDCEKECELTATKRRERQAGKINLYGYHFGCNIIVNCAKLAS